MSIGKDSARRAIFGRHVGDGGAIGQREIAQPGPEVFDKLSDYAVLAQHLGNGQNEIGCSRAFAQPSRKLHAHHQRNQHGNRLSEHRRLGFNSTDAPPQNAQPIHHGGVTVGADQGVGVGDALAGALVDEDYAGQIFEVDLVDDAGVGRDDGQIAESGLAPAEEGVALFVALEFEQGVHVEARWWCRIRRPGRSDR